MVIGTKKEWHVLRLLSRLKFIKISVLTYIKFKILLYIKYIDVLDEFYEYIDPLEEFKKHIDRSEIRYIFDIYRIF